MMKLQICLVMLFCNTAATEDMTGKIFTFSQRSNHFYVKLNAARSNFNATTVCHRSFTDFKQSHSFFSLATPDHQMYGLQTWYNSDMREMSVWVKSVRADFSLPVYAQNIWYSICSTWDSSSGVVQLWMNGRPFPPQYIVEFPLTGQPYIILGQEQTQYGQTTGFLSTMSYVGMMTDVHMWDRVLSACEIQSYTAEQTFPPGNVVNWAALDFETNGRIMIHEKQICDLTL